MSRGDSNRKRRERRKEKRRRTKWKRSHPKSYALGGSFIFFIVTLTWFVTSKTGIAGKMLEEMPVMLILTEIVLPYIAGIILFAMINQIIHHSVNDSERADAICEKLDSFALIPAFLLMGLTLWIVIKLFGQM